MRETPARKAARVRAIRQQFVDRFGKKTLTALVQIVNGFTTKSPSVRRSLAAYKANLTRGVYSDFVRTGKHGSVVADKLGLTRLS